MVSAPNPRAVTVVTVTYGDRRPFLESMLRAALAEGVGRVIVVDNGSAWDVRAIATDAASYQIEVVRLAANKGSAAGYAAGLERALAVQAGLIWLLDDDNVPEPGSLEILLQGYASLQESGHENMLCVAALRPDLTAMNYEYIPCTTRAIPDGSGRFINFHVLDIPAKIRKKILTRGRVAGRSKASLGAESAVSYVREAPYSGLLFHRSMVARLGFPRADFVLYMDDSEFTRRLTDNGGRLALLPRARVFDIERNVSGDGRRAFRALRRWHASKSYYTHRNLVWLDNHPRRHNGKSIIYHVNMVAWFSIHLVMAILTRRMKEFFVLMEAARDGMRGRMGMNGKYPLP